MRSVSTFTSLFTNIFGIGGYVFLFLEWIWLAAITMPALLKSDSLQWAMPQPATAHHTSVVSWSLPPLSLIVITSIITILMIILSIYVVIKVPITAVKGTSKATHHAADQLIPVLVHHKKISKKRFLFLRGQLLFYFRLGAVCLPVALSCFALLEPKLEISFALMLFVASSLGLIATISFTTQQIFGHLFRLSVERLV